jgi:DNA (cytosine-5)-methyltransferase 1
MRELALFAGVGGGILGGTLLGWRTVCAVELDAYCARRLMQRQNEGHLPQFPIWDDVRSFDGRQWRGHVDVVSGGFPCQDISSAGKRQGLEGEKSGLWYQMARVIGEVRPQCVLVENSPHLRTRGLARVLQDLDRMGYDTSRGVIGAQAVGAPHLRQRMWIAAYADHEAQHAEPIHAAVAGASQAEGVVQPDAPDAHSEALREQPGRQRRANRQETTILGGHRWWDSDLIAGVDDGPTNRMDRVRATGQAQIPAVAALAWVTLAKPEWGEVKSAG